MAYIEPNTTIKFLQGVPFDPEYRNTMYFANTTAQETYMNSKVAVTVEKNSYQRKSKGVLKVGWVVDTLNGGSIIRLLYNANYMMFRNDNFENKWFYAFVTNVEYVNNNTVEVYYTIDVVQTWLFAFNFNQCLIEREHTTTDAIGEHTVPENLEHGPYREDIPTYVMNNTNYSTGIFSYTPAVCLVTTFDASGAYAPGTILGGRNEMGDTFSGLYFNYWELTAANVALINQTLETISQDTALLNGVVALFMCPSEFASAAITGGHVSPKYLDFSINSSLDGYTPRNKKLLVYPYNMLYVDNNQGDSAEFRWEEFYNPSTPRLAVWGNISTNCGLVCAPFSYKGVTGMNEEESLSLTGFPMCSWTNDAYKAWVAQNVGTIVAAGVGLAAQWATVISNPLYGLASGAMDINGYVGKHTGIDFEKTGGPSGGLIAQTLGALGQIYDHKRKPPQNHGSGNSNLQYQNGYMTFSFRRKFIKAEYARIIDSYFDMYGYATHRVGTPNLNARPCYSYVKTVGASIDGNLPASDCKELEGIFDRGIRFWKTTATFGSFDPAVNNNSPT